MPAPIVTPVTVPSPTITPSPAPQEWPERFTDPITICPQQKRELTSPDVAP